MLKFLSHHINDIPLSDPIIKWFYIQRKNIRSFITLGARAITLNLYMRNGKEIEGINAKETKKKYVMFTQM